MRLKYSKIARRSSRGQSASSSHDRLTELRRGAAGGIRVRGVEFVFRLCGRGFAFVRVFAFILLQRPAGVEEPTEELLLPGDGGRVEPSSFERFGKLFGFLGHLGGAIAADVFAQLVELGRDLALLTRERASRRLHLSPTSAADPSPAAGLGPAR
jgi:hypothetical protein